MRARIKYKANDLVSQRMNNISLPLQLPRKKKIKKKKEERGRGLLYLGNSSG
jgi:hypothetical protein